MLFFIQSQENAHLYILKHESFQRRRYHLTFITSCSPSRKTRPPQSPHLDALPRIQLRPHIEIETRPASSAARSARVKVDHVVDAGAAAVDDPVMAIKGRGVAEDGVEAGGWGHALAFVGKGGEFGAATSGFGNQVRYCNCNAV